MQQYGREYLADLSIEMMVEYIHSIVLPSMVAEERSATVEEVRENETSYQEEVKAILKRYGLACICPATVYRWMKSLGFSNEPRKKCYYVDGHEKPSTVEYRGKFVKRYLQNELKMHRWIQVT